MSLASLGWDSTLSFLFDELIQELGTEDENLIPGRVVRQDRGLLLVRTVAPKQGATASVEHAETYDVRVRPRDLEEAPVVGDWVCLAPRDDTHAILRGVLPRRTALTRRRPDESTEAQVIAANVDVAFWVAPADRELSVRGVERALTVLYESGASPVVVLSKADLAGDLDALVLAVESVAIGVRVIAWSALTGLGRDDLDAELPAGRTGVLLGPSGAGKSTLANALQGEARLATGDVRARDRKGRHTTTHRELLSLPSGALLVDGPGIRELGLLSDEGLDEAFADIAALAQRCRFSDCTHAHEPGCAVRQALDEGTLDEARFASFTKLQREVAWVESRTSLGSQRAQREKRRKLTLQAWHASRAKDR